MIKKALIISFFGVLVGGFCFASGSENVYGWAWSENIGWISFNSINCDPLSGPKPSGCPVGNVGDYGVNINPATGEFSGYAWSENIGWISFNKSETGNPPEAPYETGATSYIAKFDLGTHEVSGWMRALAPADYSDRAGGWDGWIKLRGTTYGTWIDDSVSPAEFRNFGWSDMVIGWVSFNCKNCDPDKNGFSNGGAGCPALGTWISDYKVMIGSSLFNDPPEAIIQRAVELDPCLYDTTYRLSWRFSGPEGDDYQTAYQIQVDNNPSFSSPEIDTGKVFSSSTEYVTPKGLLEYNQTYYWRVKVWDSDDLESDWDVSNFGQTIRTPLHSYPRVDFTWNPLSPSIEEFATFYDRSKAYSLGGGAGIIVFRLWTFPTDSVLATPPAINETEEVRFKLPTYSGHDNTVTLRVVDQDGFTCDLSKNIPVTPPLPKWKEVAPFTMIERLIVSLFEKLKLLAKG